MGAIFAQMIWAIVVIAVIYDCLTSNNKFMNAVGSLLIAVLLYAILFIN